MTPLVDFSRRYHFSASHRLHVDALTEEQNYATFGKCNNPHGHGHNYTLELTLRGPVDPATGMVLNLRALDAIVHDRIMTRFDLQNLNCDPVFEKLVSSTENLCRTAWKLLDGSELGTAVLQRLRIEETSNNFFEYAGKDNER